MNIKKVEKIQSKTNKAFWFIEKIIARLLKYNIKLDKLLTKSSTEVEELRQELLEKEAQAAEVATKAQETIAKHKNQIDILNKLMGK